jgi:hypothetical protein
VCSSDLDLLMFDRTDIATICFQMGEEMVF